MNIVIDTIKNTTVTYKQVIDLMHESFEERLEQGLHFSCSSMTEQYFTERTKGSEVIVAIDKDTRALLGTATFHIYELSRSMDFEYVAIAPQCKGHGIATMIFTQYVLPMAESSGCGYILSTTATKADSSIRWHKKQGFRIIGQASFSDTNYYSYVFRKQLIHPSKWDCKAYTSLLSFYRMVITRMTRSADGSYTFLGRLKEQVLHHS